MPRWSSTVQDFGEVEFWGKGIPYRYVTYARIQGVEYGTPRFPVAVEPTPEPSSVLELSASPNPFRDRIVVGASEALLVVEVFDVLGRRVAALEGLQAVGREVTLDLRGLLPGPYVVRAEGESGCAAVVVLKP